ncbi:Asp23/Gls24 family envelope stress response protein [Jannaschia sp. R86511]|uniref:Asp23/Gls24 family envelope stress response protein n=1 Tax=Jannaschia sp. R86511 TaxID=3093853 RepID=UPI0036D28E9E
MTVPADPRGVTTVADRVVQKIAGRAVTEVPAAGGAARRVLGIALGDDELQDHPVVDAHVDGGVVTVDVEMSVTYPEPVADVAGAVRRRVDERVSSLTGLRVAQVDIRVTSLVTGTPATRRVE